MIQDDDDIVLNNEDKTIREYTVANLLYEFIRGGNFVWSRFQNANSENNLTPQLDILYNGEALCTAVNEDITDRIYIMSKKLPTELEISYSYTTYTLATSLDESVSNKPFRSGFDISIKAKKYTDFDFNLRFKLLSERTLDAVHYDGRFYMRFVEADESTKIIVKQIKHLINYERDNDTE